MTKRRWMGSIAIIIIYFIVYFSIVVIENDFWGNILSPIGAFISFFAILYLSFNIKKQRLILLIASFSCLSWALIDTLWAIYSIGFNLNPDEYDLFMYLYTIPNIMIAITVGVFFKAKSFKWNMLQLFLDIFSTICVAFGVLWMLFLQGNMIAIFHFDTINITTLIYIITDFFSLSLAFVIYASNRNNRIRKSLNIAMLGITIYTIADIYYSYQEFTDSYIPNSIIDGIYMVALLLFGVASLYELYKSPAEQITEPSELPENIGSLKRGLSLFIAPLFVIIVKGILLNELLYFSVVIILYHIFSVYTKIYIQNQNILKQKSMMNDLLEERIEERTKELVLLNKELEIISKQDTITSLYNRRFFLECLDEMIANKEEQKSIYLLYMDLDRFKSINDSYGHEMGDQVLKIFSERLNRWKLEDMLLARLGGDEFVIVISGQNTHDSIGDYVNQIIGLYKAPIIVSPYQFYVSVSIGVSCINPDSLDRSTMLKNADIAMYYAKNHKHLQYAFYNSWLNNEMQRKQEIELLLNGIDYNQEFMLYYQPQYRIEDKVLIGMEALIRWNNPQKGMISPVEFIPIAEETGAILLIGDWVMNEAIKQVSIWNKKYQSSYKMGINISPKQLDSINFLGKLKAYISKYDIKPEWLDMEITESSAMKGECSAEEIFTSLAAIGVSISIDDFGTGYSSLSYLKRFDIDRLKIAKPLIDSISIQYTDEQIVKAIIMMAKAMDLNTIAEGVEEKDQLSKLAELGCNEVQGYFFGKPVPAKEFEERFLT